ncbi:MAG: ABC transporter permease [Kiritimatiellae bacterium]|nr:ABC transporter permease [Kiritimatiellia bacterium]
MGRYILRRIWQMVPTMFGVIVITFILFNIVGGSPAMMTLGKNVSPGALEEFDEQRGFNKPLFFGNWTKTRAFSDNAFTRNASSWREHESVVWVPGKKNRAGYVLFPPDSRFPVPLEFNLKPETGYRWVISYDLAEGAASLRMDNSAGGDMRLRNTRALNSGPGRQKAEIDFSTEENTSGLKFFLQTGAAPLKISSLQLRRRTKNFFDSQFVFYLGQLAKFEFGRSNYSNQRVSRMLKDGILPSLFLTVPVFAIGLIAAVSISLVCAFFRDTWLDRMFVVAAVALMSVNYLVWIIAGQYCFAYRLGWFPIWGFESWRYLLLPVLVGVISGLGDNLRFYRTIMLDEMYRDYVRTALAKGVGRGGVLFRHVLKNAMIPILTNVIIAIPFLYTGSLLLESFFGIPGLGNMGINAINYSDVDVVRAIVFIGALLYVAANLLTDICYALVDPRVRLDRSI